MRPLLIAACICTSLAAVEDGVEISTMDAGRKYLIVSAPAGPGAADAHLMARLDLKITARFIDADLRDVAAFISRHTGVTVVVDPRLVDIPAINLTVTDMSATRFLGWVATQTGSHLAYVNEAAYFSQEPFPGKRITRVYEVTDLTAGLKSYPGPTMSVPEPGGTGAQLLPAIEADLPRTDLDELADLVSDHVTTPR